MDNAKEENEWKILDSGAGDDGEKKEMSTEIRFEISAGNYNNETKEKTVRSKVIGVAKGAALTAAFAARTALTIALALRLAKGLREDDEEQ